MLPRGWCDPSAGVLACWCLPVMGGCGWAGVVVGVAGLVVVEDCLPVWGWVSRVRLGLSVR